jgi:ATP-dependent helicase Lhr and Lhr-like helicase
MKPEAELTKTTSEILEPIEAWFSTNGWTPFDFQRDAWRAYLDGKSGLIHTATGTGKTYAAWMGLLADWLAENPDAEAVTRRSQTAPLTALWITPLRALAADTEAALRAPVEEMRLPWSVESRTGDTSSTVRSRQRSRLPTVLVTTPESLSLLLSREDAQKLFVSLRLVVVDEWHELMATKRGIQTELALARLRRWNPALRLWGLSATMGNLETAMETLLGIDVQTGEIRSGELISGVLKKQIVIESLIPKRMERFPWAGHLGIKMLPQVTELIEQASSTLLFTNTRAQTEIWYQALLDARPDWAGEIALHHGSLDPKLRTWVEHALDAGKLRCVVCTSSLDLGVDFSPVDQVLQVGSPKGVARLLQRAGRSGHRPGAVSRVICVPTNALELLEVAAAREAAEEGHIEARRPLENPLDVLAQHLVTIALGGGFSSEELLREVRSAHAFRTLPREEWEWTVDFVTRGGDALRAYPDYHRLAEMNGAFTVENKTVARLHRLSIGTIMGDSTLLVRYLKGPKIGNIEESFISRLKRGDTFTLAGKVLEFIRVRDMTVWVRRAKSRKGVVPRWYGGSLPISDELSHAMREQLTRAKHEELTSPELKALKPILDLQAKWSIVPSEDELLIESVKTREGHHLFFYPFEGRLVHEGLAALFAYRLSRRQPITFTMAFNDYGFELLSPEPAEIESLLPDQLFSTENLIDDVLASLNAAEMAKRQFREIARISGLVASRYPGGQKTVKQLQASSSLMYDVLANYDPDNLLLVQSQREVLQRQLESTRLHETLLRLQQSAVILKLTKRPTPFAFPLLVERLRQTVSSETLEDRVRKMLTSLDKAAGIVPEASP